MHILLVRAARLFLAAVLASAAILVVTLGSRARGSQEKAQTQSPPKGSAEVTGAARLNSLGVAFMNQQRFADAQKQFEAALAADPNYALAKLNLGIALLAQQKSEQARSILEAAAEKLPHDPFAWYNLGLAYKDLTEPDKAIAAFRHVTQLFPAEPDAFYFIGYLQAQQQKYDAAIEAFDQALNNFPYHASAQFGLARAYQRKGDADAAREHLQRFQKISTQHLGSPFGAGYGDQGKFSLAEYAKNAVPKAPAAATVHFAPLPLETLLPASAGTVPRLGPSTGVCFFDYDGDGKPDLLLVNASNDGKTRLLHNLGNSRFEDATDAAELKLVGKGLGCADGDFDNDGKPDFAVCLTDGVHLLHNDGGGKFADVTKIAGIRQDKNCVGLTFVDYDHDGDLDLYITEAPSSDAHNILWRNNGNGTFTDVSAETALGSEATGAGVVTSDFNNDRAIDFIFAGGAKGASIYLNPREGKFAALPTIDFSKENLPPAVGVVSFDFDKDGWMDLAFTHAGVPGISLWRNMEGKGLQRVALPDFAWQRGWGIAAVDYDNDGWIDLLAVGETSKGGEVRLLRNLGGGSWADATADARLDSIKLSEPRAIAIADVGGSGNPDLLITQLGGPPLLLQSEGATKHNWLQIDLKALNDNKSAIGTKVEVFAGPLYQKWEIPGASGYLSQNASPVLVGLDDEPRADVVRLLWPTGVPQDEIDLQPRKLQQIAELDRRGSSCPILFAWNGREFEFIADMIGAGVVGHWIAPGERDVPDPDEYLKVSGKSAQPRNGILSFRFMEPMEETVYLDQVRLLAIDHPASYDVYPNERFVSAPPFPDFRVIASRDARPPVGAWDDQGRDVLSLIAKRDRKYLTGFDDLPFAGFAKLHWLELDLGAWDSTKPLRFIMDGYTDYFTATSMYAADQAGIKVIAPFVEVQDAQGHWVRVVGDMGFPAGLARTMIADLTRKIPAETRRIRIATNLKIYWDSIAIDQTQENADSRVTQIPLANASLAFLGYPKEIRLTPASDTIYSYSQRSKTGPYARAAGIYTRYGNVRDLLRSSDDRFVVFSSGEGVKLDFDARSLPALPAGWTRDYFFYADGFEKDMDFYAAHAFTVEPLPKHTMQPYPYAEGKGYPSDSEHLRYELEYNTRPRSGRLPANLRYEYRPSH